MRARIGAEADPARLDDLLDAVNEEWHDGASAAWNEALRREDLDDGVFGALAAVFGRP